MHRRVSALVLGLFAAAGVTHGVVGCTSDNPAGPPTDAGAGTETGTQDDTGVPSSSPPCNGPLPVMTAIDPSGQQVTPDWSCYGPGDAGFLSLADDGGDASDAAVEADAGQDASTEDASDAETPDANPPPDSSVPDASAPDAAAPTYGLHLVDFSTSAPAKGASVDVVWGPLTAAPVAFTGTVDSNGILLYPQPPAGIRVLSYHITGTDEFPLYWDSLPVVSPPGQAEGNSILKTTATVLLQSILGSEAPDPSKGILNAGARDCQGREIRGAQLVLIDGDTQAPVLTGTGLGATRVLYLKNNLPDLTCTFTTNTPRAIWAMINAPVNQGPGVPAHTYTIRLLGRMTQSDVTPVVVAEYPAESYPGAVTVLRSARYNANLFH